MSPAELSGTALLRNARFLVAPDKFKGTLTATEAAQAIRQGLRDGGVSDDRITLLPIADGGDGTVEALGGANMISAVCGPLGTITSARWRLSDGVAVIEAAAASGLMLAGGEKGNNPWSATSRGTGELVVEALERGATRVLVGLGGVATTDGGRGALEALRDHVPFAPGVVEVLSDTATKFRDAAIVFGPQKGATGAQITRLTERLRADASEWEDRFGFDVYELHGGGAAGGLGGALVAAGARLCDGAETIADGLGLDRALESADVVITGEGRLDATTLNGKGPGLVIYRALRHGLRVVAIAGVVEPISLPEQLLTISLVDAVGARRALSESAASLQIAATEMVNSMA